MKRARNHAPLLVLAIASAAVVCALYAYMFHVVSASVSLADAARNAALSEKEDQSRDKSLVATASTTALDRARLASFLVPAEDEVLFITALESLGPQSGSSVSIASIAADSLSGAPSGTIGSAHAHIDASGSWPSVMRALSLAERMPYAVSISGVSLNASAAGAGSHHTWALSFDIQAPVISP